MKTIARRDFLLAAGATTCLGMATPRITSAARKAKIKIGQIGTGHAHASGVFSQLRQTDDFEIVGIVENTPQHRQALLVPPQPRPRAQAGLNTRKPWELLLCPQPAK